MKALLRVMKHQAAGSRLRASRVRRCGTHAQAGVGMIEVLVAVLIVSIAFLGIAALQAMSLSTNNSAMARSMATMASYSIMDAMRADLSGVRGGAYNTSKDITADKCPAGTGSMAADQLNQWCKQLGDNLGEVTTTTGNIACSVGGDCTVTIKFNDIRKGADGTKLQTVVTRAIL
jgi:type IV pilus assembly protein PilV